jgi:signal peptidase II
MGDVFRFEYTENTGIILGLGAGLAEPVRFWSLIVIVGAVLIGILRYVWTSKEMTPVSILGGSLIVGGGFSNLIDRLFNDGAVVDFMNIGVGNVRTAIFNVADVAIMIGIGTLLVSRVYFSNSEEESTRVERV